jgi:hypothetical protein
VAPVGQRRRPGSGQDALPRRAVLEVEPQRGRRAPESGRESGMEC